jgi:hypothetical protein
LRPGGLYATIFAPNLLAFSARMKLSPKAIVYFAGRFNFVFEFIGFDIDALDISYVRIFRQLLVWQQRKTPWLLRSVTARSVSAEDRCNGRFSCPRLHRLKPSTRISG